MNRPNDILERGPAVASKTSRQNLYSCFGKRLLDAALAIASLALTAPVFAFCAVAIKLQSRGPVFFRQVRIGRFGKPFRILKFRSMIHGNQGPRVTAAGDPRITAVGRWLRKTKIDEIPQLINVLLGDMSFVGPRPEVPEYVAAYTDRQQKVLQFRPGITGPAALQMFNEEEVLSRSSDREAFYVGTLLPHKLELELAYCESVNLRQDLKLIFRTVLRVLPGLRFLSQHQDAPTFAHDQK